MTNIKNTLSRLNLLRGLLLLSLFGMPGILQFDITGVTQQFGLFNLQSFSRIAVYLSIGILYSFSLLALRNWGSTGIHFLILDYPLFITPWRFSFLCQCLKGPTLFCPVILFSNGLHFSFYSIYMSMSKINIPYHWQSRISSYWYG